MITTPEEYALPEEQPWQDFPDPGFHRTLGGTSSEQRDAETRYNVTKNIFQSQENVRQAVNKALTAAVPENFRRAGGNVRPNVYMPTDDPRAILISLHRRYGPPIQGERRRPQPSGTPLETPASPSKQCF